VNSKPFSAALVVLLAILMILMFLQVSWPVADPDPNTNEDLGLKMFGDSADPGFSPVIIMIAILLIVALLGAVFLAKEEEPR